MRTFVTASVCVLDAFNDDPRLLTVRKAHTAKFMLPGGKIEPGESAQSCAVREAYEETGLSLDPVRMDQLGQWTADAANEPGHLVQSCVHLALDPVDCALASPSQEIAEIRWQPVYGDAELAADPSLAPLLIEYVLPGLRQWLTSANRSTS